MTEPVFQLNAQPLLLGLDHLAGALTDKTPLLGIIGNLMVRSIHQTFREQGSPAGSWRPLYAGTLQQDWESRSKNPKKPRKAFTSAGRNAAAYRRFVFGSGNKPGRRILMGASGDLYGKINFAISPEESAVRIGTNLRYARIHQLGGVITPKTKKFLCFPVGGGRFIKTKKVTMPARPYIVLRPEDPERIRLALGDYLQARFGARA